MNVLAISFFIVTIEVSLSMKNKLTNFEKGILYENLACSILKSKNLDIVGKRIKSKIGEIDILAKKEDAFYITEIKFRHSIDDAAHSISEAQFNRSLATFFDYVGKNNIKYEKYFYIAILFSDSKYKVINVTTFNENLGILPV